MSMTLSRCSSPSMPVVCARIGDRPVQVARQGLAQDVPHKRALARAGHTGHANKKPNGESRVDVFEVIVRGPLDREKSPVGTLRSAGSRSPSYPRGTAGQALRASCQVVDRPLGDDFTSLDTGPGPKVDQVVGRRTVSSSCSTTTTVLPSSASRRKRRKQAVVVARMQADRRLVENVQHPHQPG